jgi:poly(3-hydroxybutyrate) depolymerase
MDPGFPGMPAMLLHGDADKVVRPVNLQQVARQFWLLNRLLPSHVPVVSSLPARTGGRSPRHALKRLDYRVGRKPVVSVCRIDGLEHAWSGGDAALRFNSKLGPDASALLWAFFEKHRRPSKAL